MKSAGTWPDAETQVTKEMLDWADRTFVMEGHRLDSVVKMCPSFISKTAVLDIEDEYSRNSARLVGELILKMANIVALDEWVAQRFDLDSRADEVRDMTDEKTEYYTEEKPYGGWSRALDAIRKKALKKKV